MRPSELLRLRGRLTPRDLRLLEDLRRFRLLTTRHLQRLHFRVPDDHASVPGATRAAHRVLGRLAGLDLVSSLSRRIGGAERGSAGALWQLTDRGQDLLVGGADARKRMREPTSALFMAHTAAVADLAVSVVETCRVGGLELLELLGEPDGWRQFVGPHGAPEHVRPDLVAITADKHWQQTTFYEVDLGTEHGPQLARKQQLYERYIQLGAAEHDFGVTPRIVWVAPDPARERFMVKSLLPSDRQPPVHAIIVTRANAAAESIVTLEASDDREKGRAI